MAMAIPFDRASHLIRIPVQLSDGSRGRFLLDSGIGVSILAPVLVQRLGLIQTGETFTGRRMSGQPVTAELVKVPRLGFGSHVVTDAVAGVVDLGPTDGAEGFDGIVGLDILADVVVTVDPLRELVEIHDHLEPRPQDIEVRVRVDRDGPSVCLFADIQLPSGRTAHMEIDNGSGCLILDSDFIEDCGLEPGQADIETVIGTDETGHSYTRRFARMSGDVQLVGHPGTIQQGPRTMFQDIIHDGLIGAEFLDRFIYSLDVRRERIVLSAPD
jgi:hypothetical protein